MNWQPHAQQLAEQVTHRISRWRPIIAVVPRHVFVPRWWKWTSPGSGYGTAVLASRLGDSHVTSIDVDSYLTKAATERLDGIGLRPHVVTCDSTGPLPGTYDRIVATVSARPIPRAGYRHCGPVAAWSPPSREPR